MTELCCNALFAQVAAVFPAKSFLKGAIAADAYILQWGKSFDQRRLFRNISWKTRKSKSYGKYEIIQQTGVVSPVKSVPDHIIKPPYAENESALFKPHCPEIKAHNQIEAMKKACNLAKKVLRYAKDIIQIGITTDKLDSLIHDYIVQHNAYPSPLKYRNYPKSICTSINNVVCHGIPDNRLIRDGDIINVDITVFYNGFHGDCSETFLVGNVDDQGQKLVYVTRRCLDEAINVCFPGRPFSHIGAAIETCARRHGYNVVPCFTGHGIGEYFHGPPDIFHFYNTYPGRMESGMTFTIEPAVSQGSPNIVILKDGWTAVTTDGSRAAQSEETVLITDAGVEILTT